MNDLLERPESWFGLPNNSTSLELTKLQVLKNVTKLYKPAVIKVIDFTGQPGSGGKVTGPVFYVTRSYIPCKHPYNGSEEESVLLREWGAVPARPGLHTGSAKWIWIWGQQQEECWILCLQPFWMHPQWQL